MAFNSKFFVALFLVVSAGLAGCSRLSAWAEQQNLRRCFYQSAGLRIAACTAAIRSGAEKRPTLATLFNYRGIGYDEIGQHDLAIQDYTQAIRLKPMAVSYYNRGNAYHEQRLDDLAIRDYSEAIRLMPSFVMAFSNRGVVYFRKGRHDLALQDFDAAIRIRPSDAAAYVGRSLVYDEMGQHDLAIEDLNQAIRLQPNNPVALNDRCYLRAKTGHGDIQALLDCNQALMLRPGDPATLDSVGFVLLRLGRWDDAIRNYTDALAKKPDTASSLYGRGLAKLRKGDETGNADVAAAENTEPGITKEFAGYGLTP